MRAFGMAPKFTSRPRRIPDAQVVQDLRPMLGREFAQGFDLNDDGVEADEVRDIGLPQRLPLVGQAQRPRSGEGYSTGFEFDTQRLLVHGFKETGANLSIDLEDRALDPKHLVRIEHPFVWFVWFVDHSS